MFRQNFAARLGALPPPLLPLLLLAVAAIGQAGRMRAGWLWSAGWLASRRTLASGPTGGRACWQRPDGADGVRAAHRRRVERSRRLLVVTSCGAVARGLAGGALAGGLAACLRTERDRGASYARAAWCVGLVGERCGVMSPHPARHPPTLPRSPTLPLFCPHPTPPTPHPWHLGWSSAHCGVLLPL